MHPAHRTHSLFTTGHIAWIRSDHTIIKTNINVFVITLALFAAGTALAQGNSSLVLDNDCSQISVDYENNPNLTAQENIERMDRALLHSLNKYEGCQTTQKAISSNGSSGAAAAGGGNDGTGEKNGSAANAGSGSSRASSTMSGTETPAEVSSSTSSENSNQADQSKQSGKTNSAAQAGDTSADDAKQHAGHQQQKRIKGSGKVPGDIPAIDNDSVLEAQIRQAAMSENDPVIKAKLWNEYRKYKGLPAKQVLIKP